jgi:hypothetical protein
MGPRAHPRGCGAERLCGAIVDRLTFKGHVIETGRESYRLMTTLAERGA